MQVYREITPVTEEDFFVCQHHCDPNFDYPIHLHPEFELNLVLNCEGERIVGDSILPFGVVDLVLIGPNVPHSWDCESDSSSGFSNPQVITIQFRQDLFGKTMLQTEAMRPLKKLMSDSGRGVQFHGNQLDKAVEILMRLKQMPPDFSASLLFMELLHFLAQSMEKKLLASQGFSISPEQLTSQRIKRVYDYLTQNFTRPISLGEVADLANMSESAFSHFFKRSTNKNFTQFLIELRLGKAAKMLLDTKENISQICYACGFNNVSNFNRLFKKHKGTTPQDYRKTFHTPPLRTPSQFIAR